MKRAVAGFLCVALSAVTAPLAAGQEVRTEVTVETDIRASEPYSPDELAPEKKVLFDRFSAIRRMAEERGFEGEMLLAKDDFSYAAASHDMRRQGYRSFPGQSAIWPFASISKQLVATLIMREVDLGNLSLDKPVSAYLEGVDADGGHVPTLRELLQHRSGLANPDESASDGEWADFYRLAEGRVNACLSDRADAPPEGWSYNNCDYIVAGAVLENVAGAPLDELFGGLNTGSQEMILLSQDNVGQLYNIAEPEQSVLPGYGAAGAIAGPLFALYIFDSMLLDGVTLSKDARDEMWDADPRLGNLALGQWVFEHRFAGCAKPLRIVERRGHIGKYQLRNIMVPEEDLILIAATDQPFEFGDISLGEGATHDILQAMACPDAE